jgi:hypothetical protein
MPIVVYLVVAFQDGRPRRTEGAVAALEAYLAGIRQGEGDWSHVLDGSGRLVAPVQLLGRARCEAGEDPAAERRMVSAIADYLARERDAAWDRAWEQWTSLQDDQDRLLVAPDQDATAGGLERNQHERERLALTLFGASAWREAGLAWLWRFGSVVPQVVIDHLDAGRGVRFAASELVEGVRDLLRVIEQRRAAHPIAAAVRAGSVGVPGDERGACRR